jgi:hypothetical protein
MLTPLPAATASFLKHGAPDPMRALLGGLKGVTERARISADPVNAIALSQDINAIAS